MSAIQLAPDLFYTKNSSNKITGFFSDAAMTKSLFSVGYTSANATSIVYNTSAPVNRVDMTYSSGSVVNSDSISVTKNGVATTYASLVYDSNGHLTSQKVSSSTANVYAAVDHTLPRQNATLTLDSAGQAFVIDTPTATVTLDWKSFTPSVVATNFKSNLKLFAAILIAILAICIWMYCC